MGSPREKLWRISPKRTFDESVEELVGSAREELAMAGGWWGGRRAEARGRKAQGARISGVLWDEARRWAVEHRLLTWPTDSIRRAAGGPAGGADLLLLSVARGVQSAGGARVLGPDDDQGTAPSAIM
jgi:hypothetical protein